jgi:type IV secretion system protein VirB6
MGFFATFWNWLNGELATYIGNNTARLAGVLEPAVVTLATIYVMAWGYLHLTGKIEEPLVTGLKRIATLAIVLGACLHLWLYNTLIVDTFYNAPAQLAAAVIGAGDPVSTIDAIWQQGGTAAGSLWTRGTPIPDFEARIAALMTWILIGLLCVYSMFLIALSSVALAILLALGPLFIAALLFESTRRFFAAWISQLANYALITILTIMISALLLQVVQSYATQTAAQGSTLKGVDVLNLLLISVLVFLILRQVMPTAAGLAGGLALSSFGFMSGTAGFAMHQGRVTAWPATKFAALRSAGGIRAGYGRVVSRLSRKGQGGASDKVPGATNKGIGAISETQGG